MKSEFEHWVIRGTEPVLWTFPCRVKWSEKKATCEPSVYLSVLQAKALADKMAPIGQKLEGGLIHGGWLVPERALRKNAYPMPPGDNPEEHFSWERVRIVPEKGLNHQYNEDRRRFLDWVYQKGYAFPFCKRREEVDYVYHHLCKAMLDWLVNEEQPVDLFFAQIHNWPWGSNWKEKWKKTIEGQKSKRRWDEKELAADPNTRKWALGGAAFHMADTDTCVRTLEIEPTHIWHKLIKRVERTRFELLKAQAYADEFIASAVRQYSRLARILAARLGAAHNSSAQVIQSYPPGRHRFVPRASLLHSRPALRRRLYSVIGADGFIPLEESDKKRWSVHGTACNMREVPAVQPQPGDVRNSGGDLPQPDTKPAGAAGVLVLPPGQGSPPV